MNKKSPRIYVFCPEEKKPIGGVKQLYRLVDVLNRNNFNAAIIHKNKNFRVNWFENSTNISYFPALFNKVEQLNKKKNWKNKIKYLIKSKFGNNNLPEKDSIIIFPEVYGPYIHTIVSNRIIIFNQNCYYTYDNFPKYKKINIHPYQYKNVIGTLVVSQDSLNYLKYAYEADSIYRIHLGISDAFSYNANKEKTIAFMPRKLSEDSSQIFHILNNKLTNLGWNFISINNKSEKEVAAILNKAAIFLSFNYNEGFGLPPVEAMKSGCYVIGYGGNGGNEYFKEEFSSKIVDRDIISFVKEIESTCVTFNENSNYIIEKGKKAHDFITKNYNLINEENDIVYSFNQILKNNL